MFRTYRLAADCPRSGKARRAALAAQTRGLPESGCPALRVCRTPVVRWTPRLGRTEGRLTDLCQRAQPDSVSSVLCPCRTAVVREGHGLVLTKADPGSGSTTEAVAATSTARRSGMRGRSQRGSPKSHSGPRSLLVRPSVRSGLPR